MEVYLPRILDDYSQKIVSREDDPSTKKGSISYEYQKKKQLEEQTFS